MKQLCAEGTVTAISTYEARNTISKTIQEFSPLTKLLTRICYKSTAFICPLNWRDRIEVILHSAGFCPARKCSQASGIAIPEVWITSRDFWPTTPLLPASRPFFCLLKFTYLFCLFTSSSYPLSLLLSLIILHFIFQNPFLLLLILSKRLKPDCNSAELLQWQKTLMEE